MSKRARLLRSIIAMITIAPVGPSASTMVNQNGETITDQTGDPLRTIQDA